MTWPKLLLTLKVLELGYVRFEECGRGRQHPKHLQWGDAPKLFDCSLSRPKSYFVAMFHADRILGLMPIRHQRFPYVLDGNTDLYYKSLLRAQDMAGVAAIFGQY